MRRSRNPPADDAPGEGIDGMSIAISCGWRRTGRNAMKGFGFFVGGLLLEAVGFRPALWLMAAMLAACARQRAAEPADENWARRRHRRSFRELFAKSRAINLLAAARIFLFGSRDVWFVVGLPVFLYAQGWKYMEVAGFIAAWTIGYGLVQAIAPSVVRRSTDGLSREIPEARLWGAALTAIPVALVLLLQAHLPGKSRSPRGRRSWRVRVCLRGNLVAALLPDPRLCGVEEGRRGCRLLLCRQRGRPAFWHPVVGSADAIWQPAGLPVGFGSDAGALPGAGIPAARRDRDAP